MKLLTTYLLDHWYALSFQFSKVKGYPRSQRVLCYVTSLLTLFYSSCLLIYIFNLLIGNYEYFDKFLNAAVMLFCITQVWRVFLGRQTVIRKTYAVYDQALLETRENAKRLTNLHNQAADRLIAHLEYMNQKAQNHDKVYDAHLDQKIRQELNDILRPDENN